MNNVNILRNVEDEYDTRLSVFNIKDGVNTSIVKYYKDLDNPDKLEQIRTVLSGFDLLKKQFNYFINNSEKMNNLEYFKYYSKFYHYDNKNLSKEYIYRKLKDYKYVVIKTNFSHSQFMHPFTNQYTILCSNSVKVENKIYGYKDLAKLLNKDTYIIEETYTNTQSEDYHIIDEVDHNYILKFLYSNRLDFKNTSYYRKNLYDEFVKEERIKFPKLMNIIRDNLTKDKLINDYNKFLKAYEISYNSAINLINYDMNKTKNELDDCLNYLDQVKLAIKNIRITRNSSR